MEGLIDVRGHAVPVIDLRRRLGQPCPSARLSDHLVVVDSDGRHLALHVDRAAALLTVPAEQLDGAPPDLDYAVGVVRLADDLLVIHDLAAFLSAGESRDLDAALAAAGNP